MRKDKNIIKNSNKISQMMPPVNYVIFLNQSFQHFGEIFVGQIRLVLILFIEEINYSLQ